jgi:hypothetical protein
MENGPFIDGVPFIKMVMTNIAGWKIPQINGALVRWENHL